jgi:putative protein-disulfide isomerase
MMTDSTPVLWYFADPMCSWCWGFSPVIEAIREQYRERIKIALMLGGLRPGITAPMPQTECDEILQHWREVHARSGQRFSFEGAPRAGFVYDTEPASRAVISVGAIDAAATFAYFKSVQTAFYVAGQDVTQAGVLAGLAGDHGIARDVFLARFDSGVMREKTRQHFVHTRQAEVRGFPTLIAQNAAGHAMLSNGYCSLSEFQSVLDAWLAASP